LPKVEQDTPRWRTATELLLFAAEKGAPVMMARFAMMKALHRRGADALTSSFGASRRRRAKTYHVVS
jgi:hypothetical protein